MEVVLVIATVALVLATGVLAWFTRELATAASETRLEAEKTRFEMEAARHLSIQPQLSFDAAPIGGVAGVLLIRNLGKGPALKVRLRFEFVGPDEHREWFQDSIASGESHQLNLPEPFNSIDEALASPLLVLISGRMTDLDGREVAVADEIQVSEWWATTVAAKERILGRDKLIDDRRT